MIASLNPALIVIVGALFVPLLKGRLRDVYIVALPILAALQLIGLDHGNYGQIELFDYQLVLLRVDRLSFIFGLIFLLATLLGMVFALHVKDTVQHVAGLIYAGAGTGAVFAGDMISLFVYWELTAITSVFLIWASRTERAYRAGLRYLVIQVGSGVLLLAGVIMYAQKTGSIAFDHLGLVDLPTAMIFIAIGIKCAFPLLHNWLQDAYPEATVTGTVILSAFTTKLAVYALARAYAGTEILIYIGAVMTAFPVFFAVIENDLRRVLAYSLNNQLGFMVVGVGVGSELALNGTVAHAFCHILYKALLFMSMGAVLFRCGTVKASELGGLYKSMPWTAGFCIVGAASISAFPLFSGFISKALILTGTAEAGYWGVWLVLVFASAGVLEHSGIKIPYFAFFAHDSGRRVKEAPMNMLIAMGITAFLCIAIGVVPGALYSLLPFAVDYQPYTVSHVVSQLQLLFFAMLAFAILVKKGLYPAEIDSTVLNTDWVYRKAMPWLIGKIAWGIGTARSQILDRVQRRLEHFVASVFKIHGPVGVMARTWPTGSTVLWVAVLLGLTLILYYI